MKGVPEKPSPVERLHPSFKMPLYPHVMLLFRSDF